MAAFTIAALLSCAEDTLAGFTGHLLSALRDGQFRTILNISSYRNIVAPERFEKWALALAQVVAVAVPGCHFRRNQRIPSSDPLWYQTALNHKIPEVNPAMASDSCNSSNTNPPMNYESSVMPSPALCINSMEKTTSYSLIYQY
ncbi:hypothetical protein E2542_SST04552 [Spatholobus suberectus]|nr:hypothetical protein E2542_SST04552 [Spatholobus suberectus]